MKLFAAMQSKLFDLANSRYEDYDFFIIENLFCTKPKIKSTSSVRMWIEL